MGTFQVRDVFRLTGRPGLTLLGILQGTVSIGESVTLHKNGATFHGRVTWIEGHRPETPHNQRAFGISDDVGAHIRPDDVITPQWYQLRI